MARFARGRGRGRLGGRGRGRGKIDGVRDNLAVASSVNINPPYRPTLDQASHLQAQPTGISEATQSTSPDLRNPGTSQRPLSGSQLSRNTERSVRPSPGNLTSGEEMARSVRGRGRSRRGGRGRGRGNIEGVRDNFALESSVNINPPARPTLDQASQPQAQPTGIPKVTQSTSPDLSNPGTSQRPLSESQLSRNMKRSVRPSPENLNSGEEMARSARGRGRRGGRGRGRANIEGVRDNLAVASSVNINPPYRPTLDQASQPEAQPTGIPEATQMTSPDLSSPGTSQRPLARLEGSVRPSSENLNCGEVSCSKSKKGRGKYRSINVEMKTKYGSKIIVHIPDDIDRAVGPGARDIVNYCGLIMRSTISFRDGEWAKNFAKHGEKMWLKVKEKFEIGGGRGEHVLQSFVASTMKRLFRTWKTRLHAEYSRYDTDDKRLSHPPKDVTLDDWKFLRDPLTREKAPPDRVWELQHTRKNAKGELMWSDQQSQQIYGQIQELVAQQQYEQNENPMTGDEVLATILGGRTGYVRGKGYGKKPLKKSQVERATLGSDLSSVIESVRQEMQAEMDRKLQEEREQMLAEMDLRFQAQIEEERRQMRVEIDKRIQDQMVATLMVGMQQGQGSSTARVIQGKKQKSPEVSWGVKRKRR
ncbi:putative transcriptional regulator STERILE APETALA-like [Capsicum annuum]|nr:putative transcriptional regulator STERILE APETALA-like [Capsicum annuum]